MSNERRQFPRIKAPVFWSSSGLRGLFNRTVDVSLGGARVYSDDEVKPGSRIDLDLVLPGGANINVMAVVVWIEKLPEGAPALYDVGLQFAKMADSTRNLLASVLGPDTPSE